MTPSYRNLATLLPTAGLAVGGLTLLFLLGGGCGPAAPPLPKGRTETRMVRPVDPRMRDIYHLAMDGTVQRYDRLEVVAPTRGGRRTLRDSAAIEEVHWRLLDMSWVNRVLPPASGKDVATFTFDVTEKSGNTKRVTATYGLPGDDAYSTLVRGIVGDLFRGARSAP